jgi:hypothetical protein
VDGHRIHVVAVAPDSPADGVLEPDDALLGVNGKPFEEGTDPRKTLGQAITAAEAADGRLILTVERRGRTLKARVPIRVLGAYSATWPFDCPKSARILAEAAEWLTASQYPDGHIPGELGMNTMYAGLLFLAQEDVKYLDNARRAAYWITGQKYAGVGLNSWPLGYGGLFVAEYYLATGDETVLPWLKETANLLVKGQMACGSWGHSAPWGGYGAVNQVGLVDFIALELIRECGVPVDDTAIQRSAAFFEKYAGKGWVPYGDHVPFRGKSDNGKSALAAVAFRLLGTKPEVAIAFGRDVAASYEWREEGHTGSYFSYFWGPLAAEYAGEKAFRTFLDEQTWYYDLARTHDGGLVNQPNPENLSGRTPGTYTWSGPETSTGGMALFYALPNRPLRILGAERSVFSRKPGGKLAEAMALYRQHQWAEMVAAVKGIPAGQKALGEQLTRAADRRQRGIAMALEDFASDIREGDVYRAHELLASLERLLGKSHPRLADAQKLMAANDRWVEAGRDYFKALSAVREQTEQYWQYYGKEAMATLGPVRPRPVRRWVALAATSEAEPQTWRIHEPGAAPPKGWPDPKFGDGGWKKVPGPIKGNVWKGKQILLRRAFEVDDPDVPRLRLLLKLGRGHTADVYLNGTLVAEVVRAESPRSYGRIVLSDGATDRLKKGRNVLAIHCEAEKKGELVDAGLEKGR